MRIIPKLTLALVSGTCVVLALNGFIRVRRERMYFEADRLRDHEMIGRSLGAAAAAIWKLDGEQAAIRAIDVVNSHFTTIHIRWVASDQSPTPRVEPQGLVATRAGEPVTQVVNDSGKSSLWKTLVPLEVDGVRRGFIEISEPPTTEQRFVRGVVENTVYITLVLTIVNAVLCFAMSQWLVGSPVRALSEKARQVGRGNFTVPVVLSQRDELGGLAREMNAMADRLVATIQQLRHADRLSMVGTLASGIAHELGTPLNVVSARAGMIAAGEATPQEAVEYARIVVAAAHRMTKTIRRLLQFARREGAQKTTRDLRDVVRESLELMRPLAEKRSVRLQWAPPDVACNASLDAGQIQQVITNLVMNAMQAISQGGTVDVSLKRGHGVPPADVGGEGADVFCLRVKDNGQGIAPEHLPHIFEPFFTTKDVGEGTGLGLAVTYGIVREHGGWIGVESTLHKGTEFCVFLPVGDAA